ncbi:MAG: hypothetical protein WBO34_07750, partial [Gammaproteobacteria bacterium]
IFPTTKFVPWAAYLRDRKGGKRIIEQPELVSLLFEQSKENPDQVDLDTAIREMAEAETVQILLPKID